MNVRRNFFGVLAVIGALLLLPMQAHAQSSSWRSNYCESNNNIVQGMLEGINLIFGQPDACSQQTSDAAPQSQARTSNLYAALGDSVAAGAGLPATSERNPDCIVSDQAYPARVAAARNVSFVNVACSGATAGDLFTEQHLSGTSRDIEPQLDTAYSYGEPAILTITAGANDIYWQYYLQKCYTSTCGTTTDEVVMSGLQGALRLKLEYILASISSRSSGQPPQVLFTGYYQPFSAACTSQQPSISAAEFRWMNQQMNTLNQTIKRAVQNSDFAHYVPVSFSGHGLCTNDPWVQDINDAAPLHPTARGQVHIATAVQQYLQ